MQTFLPYASFPQSAACLDDKRLGKQRVEVKQILNSILGYSKGWRNHPATLMWEFHPQTLINYGIAICEAWINRGFQDTVLDYLIKESFDIEEEPPFWLGNQRLHESHQSNLLRKSYLYYSQFRWTVPTDLPYYWPRR